jgi:hypothetical protein
MKAGLGERSAVTTVNRDVAFIYIKYWTKKWEGEASLPRRLVHKVQCLLDWMMKKGQQKLQDEGRVPICQLGHDMPTST